MFFSNCYAVKKDMTDETAATSISILSMYLEKYYQKKVMILLDEYDTPMQEGYGLSGYWDEAVTFFKGFFNSTFKTNPYLKRGLICFEELDQEMIDLLDQCDGAVSIQELAERNGYDREDLEILWSNLYELWKEKLILFAL